MGNIKEYIKEAVEIQQKKRRTSEEALKKYKEAIAAYKANSDDEYDLLYANYQVMWIYSNMFQMIDSALPYAEKCLELLGQTIRTSAIAHFTDTGKFYEEVIRFASNQVAWCIYESTNDTNKLEKALETVSLGCNYVYTPAHFYVYDTKVRILIKLGRKEEAFRLVYNCLRKHPNFSDFSDIKKNKEYREWKEAFDSGDVEYSDSEKEFLEKADRIFTKLKNQFSGNEKYSELFKEMTPEKEISTIEEIKEKYDIPEYHYEDVDHLLVFKGDVHIKGNLDEDWYEKQLEGMEWENDLFGIVIDGNLKVDGDITVDMSVFSIIKNLSCDYLYSGDGHTLINGNAHIKYGIYGHYNDGSLEIYGELVTPYIIAGDHCMPRESDEGESIYIEGCNRSDIENVSIGENTNGSDGWGWNYFEDSAKLLSRSVWNENYEFSVDMFFNLIRKGENPFIQLK